MKGILATVLLGLVAALNSAASGPARGADGPEKDIVETAVGAGKFKTLVTAVKAAGLVGTLQGEGPFTVFAPTVAGSDRAGHAR